MEFCLQRSVNFTSFPISWQMHKCLELIGSGLEEETLHKRKSFSKRDLANNVILTSFVAFSKSQECAICIRAVCIQASNTGDEIS